MLTDRFTFLCTKEDRRLLEQLAKYLQRSNGDAIRFLIREALPALPVMPDFNTRERKPEMMLLILMSIL